MTTLVVTPTFMVPASTASVSYSLYQGNGVGTASDLASTALPTQLVFDSSVPGNPLGAATTGNAATMSVSPVFIGTANPKSLVTSTALPASSAPAETTTGPTVSSKAMPISRLSMIIIIVAVVAVALIATLLLFLWCRERTRRRGHGHGRASSEEYGTGPPASDVIRKLGTTHEKSADPFSDAHAAPLSADPFADPEKPGHARAPSESFLSMMSAPRAPYTHAASASTGSSASGKARKREMEEARKRELAALGDLARALDQKERQAQAEGRDRSSLPPVGLFKAALVR